MKGRACIRGASSLSKCKPTAYFFGFTHCPEVCPTTLFEITQRLQELGPDADRLNVAFITVDPERDTPELLKAYLESFDPRIVGLTGTPRRLPRSRRRSGSRWKDPAEGGDYMTMYTASVVVMDATGAFVTLIDYHEDPEAALAKLRRGRMDLCQGHHHQSAAVKLNGRLFMAAASVVWDCVGDDLTL